MNILIVEDDIISGSLLKKNLTNIAQNIILCQSPVEGFKVLGESKIDFLILDLILPDISGLEMCKIIKKLHAKYGDPYIIMLTSKDKKNDIITGLEAGADDYITKPFDSEEIVARIKAIQRRSVKKNKNEIYYGNLFIETEMMIIKNIKEESYYDVLKKEFELLVYILTNVGIVLTRETIYKNIWEEEFLQGDRKLDNYIWKLKKKIPFLQDKIIAVKNMGYKLIKI